MRLPNWSTSPFTRWLIQLTYAGLAVAGPVLAAAVPRGDRILQIDVNEAEDGDYLVAFELARSAGLQSVSLPIDWSALETAPGVFVPADDPINVLSIANQFFPSQGIRVGLFLRPVTTQALTVPEDLRQVALDDPRMIRRFGAFLDYVFSLIPDLRIESVAIGSEFDLRFGTDPEAWRQYQEFFRAAVEHLRSEPSIVAQHPGLKLGAEATWQSLVAPPTRGFLRQLNSLADVVMVSYYPLADGRVRHPTVVHEDFAQLVAAYPGREIHIMQIGYPSGAYPGADYDLQRVMPVLGSSALKQRRFILEAFRAWDDYAEQIRLVRFTWLTDLSQESAERFANDDPAFAVPGDASHLEFLRTLGLRLHAGSGSDKPAWTMLLREAAVRGWVGAPPDACPLPAGHPRFCQLCGPCAAGEGDCDGSGECRSGLSCIDNVGASFGFRPAIDVCLAESDVSCPWPAGHGHYCRDCGPCVAGEGGLR